MVKYIAWGRDVPTVPSPEASPAENAAQIENAALLRQCIARLSEKHRQIIHLRFYEDASLGDMAQRTALTQTKVHQAIIACALERYRLAHHAFPENLNKPGAPVPRRNPQRCRRRQASALPPRRRWRLRLVFHRLERNERRRYPRQINCGRRLGLAGALPVAADVRRRVLDLS